MKKFLAILLMLTLLCTSFVACNGNEGEVTDELPGAGCNRLHQGDVQEGG